MNQFSAKEKTDHSSIKIPLANEVLEGILSIPDQAKGLVVFAHGSGSSRFSPRNKYVAQLLQQNHLATLLFDLLTPEEEEIDQQTRQLRFDIPLLARRLEEVTDWLLLNSTTYQFRLGYFGASTGAAAALMAAATRPEAIRAVVSRGGRPDLAGSALRKVKAPTLLIVGGNDTSVINLNREALAHLFTEKRLEIIPGAGHLFEEPGTLEKVAHLTRQWFTSFLVPV
jgi:dienelactone hydrolase